MSIRRISTLLPCRSFEEFPTHLTGAWAAELLAAWTGLWHPALLSATGTLPGWHSADEPPDPDSLDGELVMVPSASRQKLASDWCDRLRATSPRNPPPVEVVASREQTVAAALAAAAVEPHRVTPDVVADFLALGFAHLQVELLSQAMRYSTVLAADRFSEAVIEAARAAVAGDEHAAREGLGRAFDLLTDARNHNYSVDIYLIEVTLLAPSTLGGPLRAKLAEWTPTNLLASGELIERLAGEHPETFAEAQRALAAGTAGIVGGMQHENCSTQLTPEALLAEICQGQETVRRNLGREVEIFGQFSSAYSRLLPEVLRGTGFRGALHAAFDGGRLPRSEQCKTHWGPNGGPQIEALSARPLDISQPKTWLAFAERLSETILHDHVATVLLAGWPGQGGEYFDDLKRVARLSPVLGKFVTLDEYFRTTREPDDWTSFWPAEYPPVSAASAAGNSISLRVDAYRREVNEVHDRLATGLAAVVGVERMSEFNAAREGDGCLSVLNPWNFACPQFVGTNRTEAAAADGGFARDAEVYVPDVAGFGFAFLDSPRDPPPVRLAEGRTLRNERVELVVSETTGGIQSLRAHRDRTTRVSQRLVFHDAHIGPTQMIAERLEVTRSDDVLGEITTSGRLVNASDELLARFTQTVRLLRGLAAAVVNVRLEPQRNPDSDRWSSYIASRLAWSDEGASFRRGVQWLSRDTALERIESDDWVEISDGSQSITCFAMGLPFHRVAGPNWLDTLLVVAGEQRIDFQFAVGLDCKYPTQAAMRLMTCARPAIARWPNRPHTPRGWFLHVGAKNVIVTHLESLIDGRAGIRLRLLETEGRRVQTTIDAFRPIRSAQITDFRGQPNGVLSVVEGQVRVEIGPHRWIQLEAEW